MTKKCKILWRNEAVTVVKYDNIDVQLPAIKEDADEIYVKRDGYSFTITDGEDVADGKKTTKTKDND